MEAHGWKASTEQKLRAFDFSSPPNSAEHGKGFFAVNPFESATFGVEIALC